jgi:hypothetical protein
MKYARTPDGFQRWISSGLRLPGREIAFVSSLVQLADKVTTFEVEKLLPHRLGHPAGG